MARKKEKPTWSCRACGAATSGWFGRCPECQAWNTVEEVAAAAEADGRVRLTESTAARPVALGAATAQPPRVATGLAELDRVLGGGLVAGSVVLLGGPPGIGKSTLLLQAAAGLSRGGGTVLYASGEESVDQVGARGQRLHATPEGLLVVSETRLDVILESATRLTAAGEPGLRALMVDSVQTIYAEDQEGLPGNLTQIRAVAAALVGFAKRTGVCVILVGHVTKDGQLAGPRLLEHLVDTVLAFEGDDERATRLLRTTKNRFGSTQELGVLEMRDDGLFPLDDPSAAFLGNLDDPQVGACPAAIVEGTRPLVVEVQALLAPTYGAAPRRTCVGVETARAAMLLAVLDRHAGLNVLEEDLFVNVAGGLRLADPAGDAALLVAIASSHLRRPPPARTLAVGEIGLTGRLRPPPRLEARLREGARLGLRRVLLPPPLAPLPTLGIECVVVRTVSELVDAL